jgi:hypothetical protein
MPTTPEALSVVDVDDDDDPSGMDSKADINDSVMDMDEHSCIDALDYLGAYYKVSNPLPFSILFLSLAEI